MNGILSAIIAFGLIASGPARANDFSPVSADASNIVPVRNVCEDEFKTVSRLAACWDANGSSSKQFGSEGGSDGGDSGEGDGGK